MTITVGQVSGAIAAAVFVVQHLLPNALIVVLVGVLSTEHSAVTWSVVQRQIGNSLWPTVLRSDTAASNGVQPSVRWLSRLRTIGLGLVGIAAVVTPLGLYEAIVADNYTSAVPFSYLRDKGPMGYGTPPQPTSVFFQRSCGTFGVVPCPGTNNSVIIENDANGFPQSQIVGNYNVTVPQATIDLYQSGLSTMPGSVSSFFDIRSRQYTYRWTTDWNDGAPYPVDTFRQLQSLILDQKIEPVSGLVVDMINGGIGFRNHTLPPNLSQGAEWTEDLLWIKPMSECVNTNLTLEFVIPNGATLDSWAMDNVTLVDNGGFVNLVQEFPEFSMEDNQVNPKLQERAYKAAWMTNAYAALAMNVTRPSPDAFGYLNSELGKRFPLSSGSGAAAPDSMTTDSLFLALFNPESNTVQSDNFTFANTSQSARMSYPNPFNISISNYTDISLLCSGAGGFDYANSTNLLVQCGLFVSPAVRADGVNTLLFEPNTTWVQSIYSCASLNKASIKTVTFSYNATFGDDLTSLNITNVQDKDYSDGTPLPLWGIEQPDPPMYLNGFIQLWGLISEDNANAPNLSTKRAAELYLPGFASASSMPVGIPDTYYIPGATGPEEVLSSLYSISSNGPGVGAFDYSGASNLALFRRWQSMSTNTTTIPQILSLVWTDLAANAMQGTRGQGITGAQFQAGSGQQQTNLVPVYLFRKRIQYHWLYAIPALLALLLFSTIIAMACVMAVLRGGKARIRYYMNHLSAGRTAVAQRFKAPTNLPRKQWVAKYGKIRVKLESYEPVFAPGEQGNSIMLDQKPIAGSTVEPLEDEAPLNPSTSAVATGRYLNHG